MSINNLLLKRGTNFSTKDMNAKLLLIAQAIEDAGGGTLPAPDEVYVFDVYPNDEVVGIQAILNGLNSADPAYDIYKNKFVYYNYGSEVQPYYHIYSQNNEDVIWLAVRVNAQPYVPYTPVNWSTSLTSLQDFLANNPATDTEWLLYYLPFPAGCVINNLCGTFFAMENNDIELSRRKRVLKADKDLQIIVRQLSATLPVTTVVKTISAGDQISFDLTPNLRLAEAFGEVEGTVDNTVRANFVVKAVDDTPIADIVFSDYKSGSAIGSEVLYFTQTYAYMGII